MSKPDLLFHPELFTGILSNTYRPVLILLAEVTGTARYRKNKPTAGNLRRVYPLWNHI